MKIRGKFRQDPKLKLHFSSFGPNWPLGPVRIPVLEAFFTGILKKSEKRRKTVFFKKLLKNINKCEKL